MWIEFINSSLIFQQNSIIKTREDKYRSKIKALETLVNGTNEENEVKTKFLMVGNVQVPLLYWQHLVPISDGNKPAWAS
jgi:hypothetical protein